MNLPKIFKRYPSLKNIKIIIHQRSDKLLDGEFDPNKFIINIYTNGGKQNQDESIAHELAHALLFKRSKGIRYLNHNKTFYLALAELVSI